MCLVSTQSIATPTVTTPQYVHNATLDAGGESGNPAFTGSQNQLAAGFSRASANASAAGGNVTTPGGGQGLQSPTMNPQTPRAPGLVVPTLPSPAMGGVFAGAAPTSGVRAK